MFYFCNTVEHLIVLCILNEYSLNNAIGHQNRQPIKSVSCQSDSPKKSKCNLKDSKENFCRKETRAISNATEFSNLIILKKCPFVDSCFAVSQLFSTATTSMFFPGQQSKTQSFFTLK